MKTVSVLGLAVLLVANSHVAEGDRPISAQTVVNNRYNRQFSTPENYEYCHPTMPNPATYEAMPGATLSLVQGFIRHGDRNFLFTTPKHNPVVDCGQRREVRYYSGGTDYDYKKTSTSKDAPGTPLADSIAAEQNYFTTKWSPYQSVFVPGTCEMEQLTERGQAQHRALGKVLRKIYVDKLGFLPSHLQTIPIPDTIASMDAYTASAGHPVYVRSTSYQRTRISALSLMDGLYPAEHRDIDYKLNHVVYPLQSDTLVAQHVGCPEFKKMDQALRQGPIWQEYLNHFRNVRTFLEDLYDSAHLDVFKNNFSGYTDLSMVSHCHNLPQICNGGGNCANAHMAANLLSMGSWEYAYARRDADHADRYNRLGLGWLVRELSERWDYFLSNPGHTQTAVPQTAQPVLARRSTEYNLSCTFTLDGRCVQDTNVNLNFGIKHDRTQEIRNELDQPQAVPVAAAAAAVPSPDTPVSGATVMEVPAHFQTSAPAKPQIKAVPTGAPKMELYSGHDETITFLLAMMGQDNMYWPPYASQILMEFWSMDSNPSEIYVRVIYNGEFLKSDKCDFAKCPYTKFQQLMKKYIPEDKAECHTSA
ncbi:hypothetical protein H4R33_005648 [Dimargaris cristalligena]|uniref:Histidine phosphatase superfamily n=1 Tax=Dimargaris cristalligena TaxID=215637 RepID=A0A4P9ZS27_9FUNG|nr:hypothetical protein H4R33_005648 [Dimargaris cristalligena]RKP36334.1 histidine phosphatase superfamily [Dimargaris cristalligena]|eukprot:RKP36334.1 histidine phosphatase superfamily [Dimargaris cristalligena]